MPKFNPRLKNDIKKLKLVDLKKKFLVTRGHLRSNEVKFRFSSKASEETLRSFKVKRGQKSRSNLGVKFQITRLIVGKQKILII